MKIEVRDVPPRATWALEQAGTHPLLARLLAARGVHDSAELDAALKHLLPPSGLKGIAAAADLLAAHLSSPICVVADYDCDGATACAVALRGLKLLGATHLHYIVPDRINDGYGLTPKIAQRVAAMGAKLLITVDNGIASVEGVAAAQAAGLQVLITDHHLPGAQLPAADALVNPNQPGCGFASKSIAGVGVMFYVLLALRAKLREMGRFADRPEPKVDSLLPLVALGTVADVVKLDANNRRLVAQGLKRVRSGAMPEGMRALFAAAGRRFERASAFDFGFALGPRINAAGRLSDMTLGIECLLTDDPVRANELAQQLDAINRARRDVQADMQVQALEIARSLFDEADEPPSAITVFDPDFHEGVVGIVAGRIKDTLHRPTFVFAPSGAPGSEHLLKGSGRSIANFHLRDALDWMAKRHPGVLLRFGGHAMAAGCTIDADQLDTFEAAFAQVASEWLGQAQLSRRILTDGTLDPQYCRADVVDMLHEQVWGNGFEAPLFADEVDVLSQRVVGDKHLKLKLRHAGQAVDAIWFGRTEPLPARARIAYRLDTDEWQGERRVQFLVEAIE